MDQTAAVASMTTATEPDGTPRLAGLDILRGIAILGILFMNINDMGGSQWAGGGLMRHLGWTTADQIAWWLREVIADGTARCLLEMLFGVGMVILTERAATAIGVAAERRDGWLAVSGRWLFGSWAIMRAYYWRNFVLFAFGLVHLYILLWPGDILHTYGLAAMIAFLFRRLGPKTLLAFGLGLAIISLGGAGFFLNKAQHQIAHGAVLRAERASGHTLTVAENKELAKLDKLLRERASSRAQQERHVAADDRARSAATGTGSSWVHAAWASDLFIWGIGGYGAQMLEQLFVWEAASTMLIGAALFRWGVIQGLRSRRFYLVTMLIGYGIGLGCRIGRAGVEMQSVDYPSLWYGTFEVARLATTLGHLSLVWLILGTATGARLLAPLAAAGRTALTVYVAQTLICLWVLFPPFGMGLYGKLGWMGLMLTAAAIDAVLLVLATRWVRHFSIAPVEWAWRSIIAGRRLPFRHRRMAAVPLTG